MARALRVARIAAASHWLCILTPLLISACEEFHQTHFYAWLRGNDQSLSVEKIDAALELAGARLSCMITARR